MYCDPFRPNVKRSVNRLQEPGKTYSFQALFYYTNDFICSQPLRSPLYFSRKIMGRTDVDQTLMGDTQPIVNWVEPTSNVG